MQLGIRWRDERGRAMNDRGTGILSVDHGRDAHATIEPGGFETCPYGKIQQPVNHGGDRPVAPTKAADDGARQVAWPLATVIHGRDGRATIQGGFVGAVRDPPLRWTP